MKYFLTIIVLLSAGYAMGQKISKAFFAISPSAYVFTSGDAAAYGGHLTAGFKVAKSVYVGGEVGLTKSSDFKTVYLPLLGVLTFFSSDDVGKTSLYLTIQPGYGAYDYEAINYGSAPTTEKGGFFFFGGGGVVFGSKSSRALYAAAGFSSFGFTVNGKGASTNGLGLRAGLMFR
jgi:hypothetical protein